MKSVLLPLVACAALAGCATYADPYYGSGYAYPGYTTTYPYGVYQGAPYPAYSTGVYINGVYTHPRRGRDRDRDGIPDRVDPDRDNDGVPNHRDARPNNPRRY